MIEAVSFIVPRVFAGIGFCLGCIAVTMLLVMLAEMHGCGRDIDGDRD